SYVPLAAHPRSTLFPYTTLFRSTASQRAMRVEQCVGQWHRSVLAAAHDGVLGVALLLALQQFVKRLLKDGGTCPKSAKCDTSHRDRKSTRLNSSHSQISYAVFCL